MIESAAAGLSDGERSSAFSRSYAYATGPAWGLLLDEFQPDWRKEIQTSTFQSLFARPSESRLTIERRAAGYGGAALCRLLPDSRRQRDAHLQVRAAGVGCGAVCLTQKKNARPPIARTRSRPTPIARPRVVMSSCPLLPVPALLIPVYGN